MVQISGVLSGYVQDYFDKEIAHSRNQYVDCLRRAVDDTNSLAKVSAGSVLQLPFLRAEKLKSIGAIVKSVGNKKFLNAIFAITSDAVQRMESIGRDDKKLPLRGKELFMLQLGFLCEGLFLPWSKACTTMLLKIASSRSQNSTLPPMELLAALSAVYYGIGRLKSNFEEVFLRPLSIMPNIVAICKDSRRNSIRAVESAAKESLHAWTLCVAVHLEKVLLNLQSKYDYSPKADPLAFRMGGVAQKVVTDPTVACDSVCKAILTVANAVRTNQVNLLGLDLTKLFWKPLGQQVVGALICHLRKQKISPEGTKVLARDLEEYTNIMALMESPATMDMMTCLKQICAVFSAEEHDVAKVYHILKSDKSRVSALTSVSADGDRGAAVLGHRRGAGAGAGQVGLRLSRSRPLVQDHQVTCRQLFVSVSTDITTHSSTYTNYKWEAPLPWETKKHLTVMAFAESVAGGANNSLGPTTLRKSSAPISALFMSEVARAAMPTAAPTGNSGRITSVDLSQLESGSHEVGASANSGRSNSTSTRPVSLYLPSRPDDVVSERSKSTDGSNGSVGLLSGGISRPDLIGAKKSGAVKGIAVPTNGAKQVVKGSTATLMSGVNRRPSGSNLNGMAPPSAPTNGSSGNGSQRPFPTGAPPKPDLGDAKSPTSSSVNNVMKSMTSFFKGGGKA